MSLKHRKNDPLNKTTTTANGLQKNGFKMSFESIIKVKLSYTLIKAGSFRTSPRKSLGMIT